MSKPFKKVQWGKLSADEARARQDRALRNFIRKKVIPHCAHYQKVFRETGVEAGDIRGVYDLPKIPFT